MQEPTGETHPSWKRAEACAPFSDRTKRTPFSQAKLLFIVLSLLCSRSIHGSRFMLHASKIWDVGRSQTYLEMQYLILVRCRGVVTPLQYLLAIAVSARLFRVRPFSCA